MEFPWPVIPIALFLLWAFYQSHKSSKQKKEEFRQRVLLSGGSALYDARRIPRDVRFHFPEEALEDMAANQNYYDPKVIESLRLALAKAGGGNRPARLPSYEFFEVRKGILTARERMEKEQDALRHQWNEMLAQSRLDPRVADRINDRLGEISVLKIMNTTMREMLDLSAAELNWWG